MVRFRTGTKAPAISWHRWRVRFKPSADQHLNEKERQKGKKRQKHIKITKIATDPKLSSLIAAEFRQRVVEGAGWKKDATEASAFLLWRQWLFENTATAQDHQAEKAGEKRPNNITIKLRRKPEKKASATYTATLTQRQETVNRLRVTGFFGIVRKEADMRRRTLMWRPDTRTA